MNKLPIILSLIVVLSIGGIMAYQTFLTSPSQTSEPTSTPAPTINSNHTLPTKITITGNYTIKQTAYDYWTGQNYSTNNPSLMVTVFFQTDRPIDFDGRLFCLQKANQSYIPCVQFRADAGYRPPHSNLYGISVLPLSVGDTYVMEEFFDVTGNPLDYRLVYNDTAIELNVVNLTEISNQR